MMNTCAYVFKEFALEIEPCVYWTNSQIISVQIIITYNHIHVYPHNMNTHAPSAHNNKCMAILGGCCAKRSFEVCEAVGGTTRQHINGVIE